MLRASYLSAKTGSDAELLAPKRLHLLFKIFNTIYSPIGIKPLSVCLLPPIFHNQLVSNRDSLFAAAQLWIRKVFQYFQNLIMYNQSSFGEFLKPKIFHHKDSI